MISCTGGMKGCLQRGNLMLLTLQKLLDPLYAVRSVRDQKAEDRASVVVVQRQLLGFYRT